MEATLPVDALKQKRIKRTTEEESQSERIHKSTRPRHRLSLMPSVGLSYPYSSLTLRCFFFLFSLSKFRFCIGVLLYGVYSRLGFSLTQFSGREDQNDEDHTVLRTQQKVLHLLNMTSGFYR